MHDSLISRAGRGFVRLFRPLSLHRDWCGGSVIGLVYRIPGFVLQVLVLRPALLCGLVVVVTFLSQKASGTAEALWLQHLQSQAAAWQRAPGGYVMATRCDDVEPAPLPAPPFPDTSSCLYQPVALADVAKQDVAEMSGLYRLLVSLSLLWMIFSKLLLPVATGRRAVARGKYDE